MKEWGMIKSILLMCFIEYSISAPFGGNDITEDELTEYVPQFVPLLAIPQIFTSLPKQPEKKVETYKTWRTLLDSTTRPSTLRRRVEEYAIAKSLVEEIGEDLRELDERESRSRSVLVQLRTAFKDIDHLIDLPPDPRKWFENRFSVMLGGFEEKKRLEDIGYSFYPLLNKSLLFFRASGMGHRLLEKFVRAIDELDAIMFFADLPAMELQSRIGEWIEKPLFKVEKGPSSASKARRVVNNYEQALLRQILLTILEESRRDLSEFDMARIGRANSMLF